MNTVTKNIKADESYYKIMEMFSLGMNPVRVLKDNKLRILEFCGYNFRLSTNLNLEVL